MVSRPAKYASSRAECTDQVPPTTPEMRLPRQPSWRFPYLWMLCFPSCQSQELWVHAYPYKTEVPIPLIVDARYCRQSRTTDNMSCLSCTVNVTATGIGILSRGQRCLDQDTVELHNTVMHNSAARVGQEKVHSKHISDSGIIFGQKLKNRPNICIA